jgi:hypothetical protein
MIPSSTHTYELPLSEAFRPPLYRRLWDPVLLTTLPHLLATMFVFDCDDFSTMLQDGGPIPFPYMTYSVVIVCSSIASVCWHLHYERTNLFFYVNYGFAGAWTVLDLYLGFTRTSLETAFAIVLLNLFVFLLNKMTDRARNYAQAHSLWHLCSVCKALLVAYMVGCRWKTACV